MKKSIKRFVPPILFDLWNALHQPQKAVVSKSTDSPSVFEYVPQGWKSMETNPEIRGWNVRDILDVYISRWPKYVERVQGTGPLGFSSETASHTTTEIYSQNTVMVFAYALALAAHKRDRLSMLDWGGAIGHYYVLAKSLLPNVVIDYHCKDVPIMVDYGSRLFPDAHFHTDNNCFEKDYDFVLASGALQYSQDWCSDFDLLASASQNYLLVTRLPIVEKCASFVFVQRAHSYGYNTAYLAWCINKSVFLEQASKNNLVLLREFVIGDEHLIKNAPEQCKYYGFLFRKSE